MYNLQHMPWIYLYTLLITLQTWPLCSVHRILRYHLIYVHWHILYSWGYRWYKKRFPPSTHPQRGRRIPYIPIQSGGVGVLSTYKGRANQILPFLICLPLGFVVRIWSIFFVCSAKTRVMTTLMRTKFTIETILRAYNCPLFWTWGS